ncbi:MAG: adenylate/guanylate cyclase domain-containing protein [Rhizobiaceae bacterium]|nr:adenylate/guanylate cyclase domain-containing protein [Rhizobiaceae bacterium]
MFYAALHFLNHALGHISLESMEYALYWQALFWKSYPGMFILYGSLLVHMGLGLWRVATLNTYRLPAWEWGQILLGLSIPFWLASHLVYTRLSEIELGIEVNYSQELSLIWSGAVLQQTALLLIVWLHGCLGIHFWLRIRTNYLKFFPLLASLAMLVPAMSITGWITAARRQADAAHKATNASAPTDGSQRILSADEQETVEIIQYIRETLGEWEALSQNVIIALAILVLVVLLVRYIASKFRHHVRVIYGDGTVFSATPGTTILDISRLAGVPHMSVCGGRARCSTCRTLVLSGGEELSPPTDAEAELLGKLKADSNIRLACQAKVLGDIEIRPLINPQNHVATSRYTDPLGWGVERDIAVFFLDIRGFSKISEKSLPYDVVFILNSFFGEIAGEVEAVNGYVDKFMGDGMMALFGLSSSSKNACRDALRAAINAQSACEKVSRMLTQHLDEPIKIGIGIHVGTAVVGRIGKTADQVGPSRLTAIGDTVNIAARLESATKELQCDIVASRAVIECAQLGDQDDVDQLGKTSKITVHNISVPINVVAITKVNALEISLANT